MRLIQNDEESAIANRHIAVVPINIKPDCVEKFIATVAENVRYSRDEEGIVSFDALQSKEDPTAFLLIEVYKSAEAQFKHRETAHFENFKASVGDLLQEPYKADVYRLLG